MMDNFVFIVQGDLETYFDEFLSIKQSNAEKTHTWYKQTMDGYRAATEGLPDWPPTQAHISRWLTWMTERQFNKTSPLAYIENDSETLHSSDKTGG